MIGAGAKIKNMVIQTSVKWFGNIHQLFYKTAPDIPVDFIGVFKEKDEVIDFAFTKNYNRIESYTDTIKTTITISKSWFEEQNLIIPTQGDMVRVNKGNGEIKDYEIVADASDIGNSEKIKMQLMIKGDTPYV